LSGGFSESDGQSGGLAEIPAKPDDLNRPVLLMESLKNLERSVSAPVVDIQDFVRFPKVIENRDQMPVYLGERLFFIEERDYDGDPRL